MINEKIEVARGKVTFSSSRNTIVFFQILVEQLDQEREKRWKAEQAEKKLMDYINELRKQMYEKKDTQCLALLATDR